MAARLLQHIYRGLVSPLTTSKTNFLSNASLMSTTTGSSKSSTNNNAMAMNALKIGGGFLAGMYIGHVVTDQGMVPTDKNNGENKDKKEDGKDEAKDKGKEAKDNAKDKNKDDKDAVTAKI